MKTLTATRQFRAAPGATFNNAQAQRYGTFLEKEVGLGERLVGPEEVVEKARPEDSPIHDAFTWDDSEAAESWRVQEARQLINHIVITAEVQDETKLVRAFHSIVAKPSEDDPPKRGYVSEQLIWQRPELAEQVVDRAMSELRGWRDRYATYTELRSAVQAVDEVLSDGGKTDGGQG